MSAEYWFRSRVEMRILDGGTETVEKLVRAVAETKRKALAKARFKVWREANGMG